MEVLKKLNDGIAFPAFILGAGVVTRKGFL
jgi:hypothetical protein